MFIHQPWLMNGQGDFGSFSGQPAGLDAAKHGNEFDWMYESKFADILQRSTVTQTDVKYATQDLISTDCTFNQYTKLINFKKQLDLQYVAEAFNSQQQSCPMWTLISSLERAACCSRCMSCHQEQTCGSRMSAVELCSSHFCMHHKFARHHFMQLHIMHELSFLSGIQLLTHTVGHASAAPLHCHNVAWLRATRYSWAAKRGLVQETKTLKWVCIVRAAIDLLQYSNASTKPRGDDAFFCHDQQTTCFCLHVSCIAPCLVYAGDTAYDSRCVSLQGSIQLSKPSYQLVPLLRR